MACTSFHSPSCLVWYPCVDLKRGRQWKAVRTCPLWSWNIMNLCQKITTSRLNFWNVIKRTLHASTPLLSFCPKPLADVEIFSNVSPLLLCWENGSQHSFLRKPKRFFPHSSFSHLVPEQPWNTKRRVKNFITVDFKVAKPLFSGLAIICVSVW